MKIKIELEDIKKIVELAFKFPLHELEIEYNKKHLAFHTSHGGGYIEWFDIETEEGK